MSPISLPILREIPLFPLGTVLFPGGPLPLRIFETRYIDLVSRCLRDGSGFGVVLISEGERRFRILERRRARDGLNLADVEWLPEDPVVPLPAEFADLAPALEAVLDQVGEPYASLERRLDDAAWVAGRLGEIVPLPPGHKQHCLELDDPVERLRFLRPLFEIRY
jgi:hypothetical protein